MRSKPKLRRFSPLRACAPGSTRWKLRRQLYWLGYWRSLRVHDARA